MRKPVQLALIALIVVLGGTITVVFAKYRKASADYTAMKSSEETTRARYDQTLDAIAEIQDSLNTIALGDANVQLNTPGSETEQQMTKASGQQALDRIAVLRESIMRSKARITQLEDDLRLSGIKVAGLQKMVANLKKSVAEKEQIVTELSTRVDTLSTQVAGLTTEVEENKTVIEEKRKELATVYYVVGTKRELMNQGVIEAKGGVLGMGKTLKPTGRGVESQFTPLDTDMETVVATSSAKVQVISPQPPTSYELRKVGDRIELHIIDPTQFRKVKQLVIMTA